MNSTDRESKLALAGVKTKLHQTDRTTILRQTFSFFALGVKVIKQLLHDAVLPAAVFLSGVLDLGSEDALSSHRPLERSYFFSTRAFAFNL